MNMLKVLLGTILSVVLVLTSLLAISTPAYANDACSVTGNTDPLICPPEGGEETLQNRIRNALTVVYVWVGIASVVVVVIGGIKYMTSSGNPEKVKSAKNTIMYAIVGLIIALTAFAITTLIINSLEGRV